MGKGLEWGLDAGLWMVILRARLSSSTPVTCMSCGEEAKEGHVSCSRAVDLCLNHKGVLIPDPGQKEKTV